MKIIFGVKNEFAVRRHDACQTSAASERNGELKETSWYGRISAAVEEGDNPLLNAADILLLFYLGVATEIDAALLRPLSTVSAQCAPPLRSGKALGYTRCCQHLSVSSASSARPPPVLLTADGIRRER